MKLRTLMVIKSVITMVFGIGFVVIPVRVLSFYGVTLDPAGAYMTRLFGAAFIVIGLLLWYARKDAGSPALKAIVLGVFIGDLIGFVIALQAQLLGIVKGLGWLTVAIYFLLALGFGYFLLKKPRTT
jgi:uncharacterized membrane protein YfcA